MSRAHSPSTGRPYGVAFPCRVLEIPRSTVYAQRERASSPRPPAKRGPRPRVGDTELAAAIRTDLGATPFHGEGCRKVWARLRVGGVSVAKRRVLRVMRAEGLLAPTRQGRTHGPKAHDGTITTTRPDEMWGTDATSCATTNEGNATVFLAVDHATGECVGIHAAKVGNRFEALEPIRQGVSARFDGYERDVAQGLTVRHDHGSQYTSVHFQEELRFLGVTSSPSYVREPEGNGCAERFIRTLKENLLWVRCFTTVEELRLALLDFMALYNASWLLERHGYLTPNAAREKLLRAA
jgi:transposase InsO family protein